jgi:PAS domain S-box-containing protein
MNITNIDDLELLEKVFDSIPENIGIIDTSFNVVKYNKSLKKFFNVDENNLKNRKCYEILGCIDICKDCKIAEVFERCETLTNELFLENPSRWVRQHFSPVFNNKGELVCAVEHLQDITEFRKIEATLRKQNHELQATEEEIRSNNEELNATNEALQKSKHDIECANTELAKSRKQYKDLFNHMLDGFALHEIILNDQGEPVDFKFLNVNPAFEKITGLQREKIINKRVKDVLPETEDYWIKIYGHVALTSEPLEMEKYSSEIGRYFHITAFSPQKYKFATIFEDITDKVLSKQQLQKSEKTYRNMFHENLSMMLLIEPLSGNIIDANPMACKFYGYSKEEITQQNIYHINISDNKNVRSRLKDVEMTAAHIFQTKHKKKNGEIREVRVSSSPVEIEGKTVLFSIVQDITAENEAKNKLIEKERELEKQNRIIKERNEEYAAINEEYLTANEELADQNEKFSSLNKQYKELNQRLVEKNEELRIALQKASESDKLKSSFLANMSHEIRTPMNGIIGFTELLQNDKLADEKKNQYIEIIKSSTHQLLRIINDIIDISKIEANQLTLEMTEVNLNDSMKKIHTQFEEQLKLHKKNDIDLILDMPDHEKEEVIYLVDEVRLTQILYNLLSNALKFTSRGHIKFGYRQEHENVVFYVEDTGKGIIQDKLNIIFERFRQEEESFTRSYGGFGLGLTISKGLVELFNGSIWVNSVEDKGSTFYFSLPLKKSLIPEKENAKKEHISLSAKQFKVLIVEYQPAFSSGIQQLLHTREYECYWVDSGIKAIEFLKKNTDTDLILMDINIPVLDGYNTTARIRNFNTKVFIVGIGNETLKNPKTKAIKAGLNEYISKPVTPENLYQVISRAVYGTL